MNMDNKMSEKRSAENKRAYKGRDKGTPDAVPGINTPGIELPAFNPPVPNRAWTAMRAGLDIDELTEEEKRDLYLGNDDIF